jgi:deoxyribodipyrimidine photolyase
MSKGIIEKPNIRPLEIDLSHISVDINFRGNSVKNSQQIGGAENGWKYLESFFQGRSNNYKQDMSSPLLAETSCSRISPYLAYGNLSVREVLWFVKNNSFKDKKMSSSVKSFKSRLAWKDHFGQKLEDDFLIESACLHRSYENLRPKIPDITLLTAWENGETEVFAKNRLDQLSNAGYVDVVCFLPSLVGLAKYWQDFSELFHRL